jgi:Tfp pilus assembly protein PilF
MPPPSQQPPQQQHVTPDQAVEIGLQHHRHGNLSEAEAIYRKVLAAQPDHPAALHWLAVVARETGHKEDGLKLLERSVELNPHDPLARQDMGETMASLGRFTEAEQHYLAALAILPDSAPILNDLSVVYHKMRRYSDALATVDRALALHPDLPQGHSNRGMALTDLCRFDEAIAALDRSLRLRPNHRPTQLSKARALFLRGDLPAAFELYELRFGQGEIPYPKLTEPMWDGRADVSGKTVLVVSEQGAGDTIHFARYATMLKRERGCEVILICIAEVKPLLTTLGGGVRILGSGEDRPRFDYHVPILSLPRIFGTTLETIPREVPYLSADPARVAKWRDRFASEARPKVGVVWAGSATHKSDRNRSMPLATLWPLLAMNEVAWFSLQKGPPAAQIANMPNAPLDLAPDLHEYADTAAAIEALDLVVTVDTSVAHVAGALARPVWTMLSYEGEWRWTRVRPDDSPWYPTMRLFRQSTPGAWDDVIDRVAREVRQLGHSPT